MHQTLVIAIILLVTIVFCALFYRILVALWAQALMRYVTTRKARAEAEAARAAAAAEAGEAVEVVLEPEPAPPPAPPPAPDPTP